jgi:hypothetical protein
MFGDLMQRPEVSSGGEQFKCHKRFSFKVRGSFYNVELEHTRGQWRVMFGEVIIGTRKHNKSNPLTKAEHTMEFTLSTEAGVLQAHLQALWNVTKMRWDYDLQVAGVAIIEAWDRDRGCLLPLDTIPELFPEPVQSLVVRPAGEDSEILELKDALNDMMDRVAQAETRNEELYIKAHDAALINNELRSLVHNANLPSPQEWSWLTRKPTHQKVAMQSSILWL